MKEYMEQVTNIFGQQRDFRLNDRLSASPIAQAFASDYSNLYGVSSPQACCARLDE
jgi:hypothetical protein